jgi:hypothetical protein
MTAKHRTPEYQRNARIIRARVKTIHVRGEAVTCWRCRGPIRPGQPFDVGHVNGATGSTLHDLAPEHRHTTGSCVGNRADGGRQGAAITNRRPPARAVQTWQL